MEKLEVIVNLASMISKTFGELVQVTVNDMHSYVFVENPVDPAMQAGDEIGGNEKYFLDSEAIKDLPFVVNYKSLSKGHDKLRSSTYLYRDDDGRILYMMSLTIKVDEFLYLRDMVDLFVNGSRQGFTRETTQIDQIPKLEISVQDLIATVVAEGQKRYSTTVERMTKMEKQSLLREMASRGVFLIKGAVGEAAKVLHYSETTIYKFLQRYEKHE